MSFASKPSEIICSRVFSRYRSASRVLLPAASSPSNSDSEDSSSESAGGRGPTSLSSSSKSLPETDSSRVSLRLVGRAFERSFVRWGRGAPASGLFLFREAGCGVGPSCVAKCDFLETFLPAARCARRSHARTICFTAFPLRKHHLYQHPPLLIHTLIHSSYSVLICLFQSNGILMVSSY
jgi:hypothetical protein